MLFRSVNEFFEKFVTFRVNISNIQEGIRQVEAICKSVKSVPVRMKIEIIISPSLSGFRGSLERDLRNMLKSQNIRYELNSKGGGYELYVNTDKKSLYYYVNVVAMGMLAAGFIFSFLIWLILASWPIIITFFVKELTTSVWLLLLYLFFIELPKKLFSWMTEKLRRTGPVKSSGEEERA